MAKRPYSKAHTAKGNPRRYLLSGIPPTLWARARAKAAKEGVSMRSLILTLLVQWLEPVVRHDMSALAQQQRLGEPIGTIGDAVLRTLKQINGEG